MAMDPPQRAFQGRAAAADLEGDDPCASCSHRAFITSRWSAPIARPRLTSGGCARHAVRVRAAQPRSALGEPSVFRSRRRAADHGVHRRRAPADPTRTSTDIGTVHHIAFAVSRATFQQAVERLDERRIRHSGVKDRGFMDSIYFTDPLGLLIELASYRFEPPAGFTHADVLMETASGCNAGTTRSPRSISPMRSSADHPRPRQPVRGPVSQGPLLSSPAATPARSAPCDGVVSSSIQPGRASCVRRPGLSSRTRAPGRGTLPAARRAPSGRRQQSPRAPLPKQQLDERPMLSLR